MDTTYNKETVLSGNSSEKTQPKKLFQKNLDTATTPRSTYNGKKESGKGSRKTSPVKKKKSVLPSVDPNENLNYEPREKLRSSKMDQRE